MPSDDFDDRVDRALEALWRGSSDDFDRLVGLESGDGPDVAAMVRDAALASSQSAIGLGSRTRVGQFRIIREIGVGGMGVVYEAQQAEPDRRVALKVIRTGKHATEHQLGLFQRESRTLARLTHPGIAAVYEAGRTDDGQDFFAMELLSGPTLTDYAAGRGTGAPAAPLVLHERLDLFCQVCDAISYAHQRGVIHRDLKPSNVIIDSQGRPKILDFGLARVTDVDVTMISSVTETGKIMGTLPYMSPEQTRGDPEEIDTRSDVYSLGVILFELLTDRLPYDLRRRALPEAARVICEESPAKPGTIDRSLPGDVETVVLKALEKDPDRRYQSAAALSEDIRRYIAGEPILGRPSSAAYRFRKLVGRHKLSFSLAVTLSLLLIAFAISMAVQSGRLTRERDKALAAELRAAREAESARREATEAEQVRQFLQDMLAAVDPADRGREVSVREVLDRAASQIETDLADDPEARAAVRATIGRTYCSLGIYDAAERHLVKALETRRGLLGDQHADVAESMQSLAKLRQIKGDHVGAVTMQRGALETLRRVRGDEHPEVAEATANLAEALHAGGDLKAAEPLYTAALDLSRRLSGHQRKGVSDILSNFARLLFAKGEYDAAEPLLHEALAIDRELHGDEHIKTASSLHNLAQFVMIKGDYSTAEPLFRETLALHQKLLGNEHADVATCLNNLAELLRDTGRYEEAEVLYREALAVQRRALGPEHPHVAIILNNIAKLLSYKGDYAAAEPVHREALALLLKLHGPDHTDVAVSQNDLARFLQRRGDYADAESLYRQALATFRTHLGSQHSDTAGIMGNLADVLCDQGKMSEAEALYGKVLTVQRETLGNDHPNIAFSLYGLAKVLRLKHEYAAAEPLYEEMLAIRRKALPPKHPDIASGLATYAVLLLIQAKYAAAEPLLRECLAIRGEILPQDDWQRFNTMRLLGVTLTGQGKFDKAEPLLLNGNAGIRDNRQAPDSFKRRAQESLVQLYEAWGKPAEAAKWRAEQESINAKPATKP
jgi:serine/threonine protein kinase/Tfp pilus assembly protein PilF